MVVFVASLEVVRVVAVVVVEVDGGGGADAVVVVDAGTLFTSLTSVDAATECLDTTRFTVESSGTLRKSVTTSDWHIPSTQTSLTSRSRSPGFSEPSSIAAPAKTK